MRGATLVSAIVPFRNEERFLRESVESVLAQTYRSWELLLVDDGSTDGSTEIARDYASRHRDRVRYLSHADGRWHGLSATRNAGVAHAGGDYIAFLDADDVWLPRKLEQQTALLASIPEVGMLYGSTYWWRDWDGNPSDGLRDHVRDPGVTTEVLIDPPTLIEPYFALRTADIPSMSSAIFPRSVVERLGGWDESFLDLFEDQVFYAKVCVELPVFASTQCWDRRRQHRASLTGAASDREFESARLRFLTWLIEFLEERGLGGTNTCAAVKRRRFRLQHPRLARAIQVLRRAA
jgi:glycosyltransferase involved in cell wall biosynthesis